MTSNDSAMTSPAAPARTSNRWVFVGFLALLFVLSVVDRFGLTLLIEPLKAEMRITDSQVGLLIGPAFSIFYAMAALPMAWLIDKNNRRIIIIIGVMFWSAMTFASAFANSFEMLFAFRIGLALGEAVLTPAAVSLVSDLFPRSQRALPTGIFAAAGTIGGSLAYILTGAIVQLTLDGYFQSLPLLGHLDAWRMTLALTGLLGYAVIALAFIPGVAREPPRQRTSTEQGSGAASDYLGVFPDRNTAIRFYAAFFFGCATVSILTFSMAAWYPTFLVRQFGFTLPVAGYTMGTIYLIAGAAGSVTLPMLIQFFMRRGRNVLVIVTLIAMLAGAPLLALAVTRGDAQTSILIAGCAMFFINGSATLPTIAVSLTAGPLLQGRLAALGQMLNTVIGLGLGPVIVGLLTQHTFSGDGAIGQSLAVTALSAGTLALIVMSFALAPYARSATVR